MKLSALYIDDERTSYLAWGRPLETRFGWHIDYAADVDEAFTLLKHVSTEYDAVVLDRMMPDPNREGRENVGAGDNLLREIVTRYPYCCVVMFTNISDVSAAQRNARRGAYAFLTKGAGRVDDLDKALRNGVAAKRVDRLYDRVLLENREETPLAMVEELAEILRALHRTRDDEASTARLQACYLPISAGGSPSFPVGRNLERRTGWLPQDPACWNEILSDQRVVETFANDLQGQWTATQEFCVRHQVLVPVRTEKITTTGRVERFVTGVICLESDRPDVLLEEQVEIAERVARAIGLMLDARRKSEKALSTGERLAERDLHAEFAHRVRNPLQTAQLTLEGLVANLDRESVDSALIKTRLGRLSKALQSAIEASLSFKDRSQPGQRRIGDIDLGRLLRELVSDYPEPRRGEIHLESFPKLPPIHGEPDELTYAFRCLLENSLDAIDAQRDRTGEPGHIEISLDPDPTGVRDVRISVVDNGCGFKESVERIFERGFSTKQQGSGHSGLGLWEAKRIVHEHGGEIEAVPAPKGGAYVSVLLPLKPGISLVSESATDA